MHRDSSTTCHGRVERLLLGAQVGREVVEAVDGADDVPAAVLSLR